MTAMDQRVEELLNQLTLKEKVALLSGQDAWNTVPIERLGIPSLTMTDGPHGVRANRTEAGRRAGPTTAFPTGVSLASSWNPELVERASAALGEETRAMGCDILLGPCVNIVRHPLAGRNFEAYSEDPYLAGRIGAAWVTGVQSQSVGASLKHFACNNQEFERFRGSSIVDERTLREIYLPQFEMIVKDTQPWTVMCAYNRINGVYASQHNTLLNEILRGEWGFEGVVVSDWAANHTTVESVQGGLDIEMPGPAKYYGKLLVEAVNNWQIDEAVIDNAVRRILKMILRSGQMDNPQARPAGAANTFEHQRLAREIAEEAITLLKNDNHALPLKIDTIQSIAVIGPNAADLQISGGGSSRVEPPYRVSPLEGLKAKLGQRMKIEFEPGCDNYVELPAIKPAYLTPAGGAGHGVKAEYFANADLSGVPDAVRVEPTLDLWWWNEGPDTRVPVRRFSARWTGKLIVPQSGRHTLKLSNTGRARLYLDGKLVIEQAATSNPHIGSSIEVELTAGREYDLKAELIKTTDEHFAHLRAGLAYRPEPDNRFARAVELARSSDVAIVFAGLPENYETEGRDRPDMELTGPQAELIQSVAQANRNTIVVLNVGSPVTMPWLDDVAAVVLAYYPGMEGGHVIANILCGDANPSGKLTVTYPKRLADTPAFINYPGAQEVYYGEGIFVGYRYYDQRDIAPLFPFGHGLSYTTFEYGEIQVPASVKRGAPIEVSITVKNTGSVEGKEVAQLYLSDQQSSLARPPKELKGFAKVALRPGESQTVRFTLDERALSFYDPNRRRWAAEPGEFEILIGSSSRDIRARATFKLE